MTFTERLTDLLKESNLSRRQLATQAGIPSTTINNWFVRGSSPTLDILERLASVFNCSIDYLSGRCDIDNIVISTNYIPSTVLSVSEQNIIDAYRQLTTRRQAMATGYIVGLLDDQRKHA